MTHVHIGPYLVIPKTNVEHKRTVRLCSTRCCATEYPQSVKFCPACGSAVVPSEQVEVRLESPSIRGLSDQWTDFMWSPSYTSVHELGEIWLPNHRGHGLSLDVDPSQHQALPLAAIDGARMLKRTRQYYAGFVQAIEQELGVVPQWEVGVVLYSY